MIVYLNAMRNKDEKLSQTLAIAKQAEAFWLQEKDKQTQEVIRLEHSTKALD